MPELRLMPPCLDDAAELLRFETDNRAFFEARINARPAAYYSAEGVRSAILLAEQEAQDDRGYQFLVRTASGELVGRVNLVGVRRTHFQMAELGYRFAESAGGKGYAREAVRQVVERAFGELGLMRLEAVARVGNEGSIKVLQRNGFREFGRSIQSFLLGGVWHDRLHFERRAA
jgi:ribosomal-protein-alanine N-acetyltransferase